MSIDPFAYQNFGLPTGEAIRVAVLTNKTLRSKKWKGIVSVLPRAVLRTRSLYSGRSLCVLSADAVAHSIPTGQHGYVTLPVTRAGLEGK